MLIGVTGTESNNRANVRLNVARLANLPGEVISVASEKSRTMEEETKTREKQRWYGPVKRYLTFRNEKAREVAKMEYVDLEALIELVKRLD